MERNLRKERVGVVVSDKMDKTVVVAIEERYKHPLYKKTAFYYPEIPQSYLRRWLSLDECRTLAKELNVRKRNPYDNESGTERMTWNTLKEKLSEFGYHYERKRYKKMQIVYFIDGEYIPMIRSA